ncbi:MAG TPA: ATP-binding protein, partial [Clostridia bacterium]|nr:ATP-binding protein [Clostridia bacterium]
LPNGDVAGVVLLHSQLADISKASSTGLWFLLISMFMAVLISFVIAGALASRFTRPLEKMKHIALQISGGDFTAKTDIKQNDEIGELAFAMDKMAAQLEDASQESEKIDQLRREFLANVSHELRTPVTVLRGSLEALCDEVVTDPDTVADYHRQMLTESIHLERLVADLLDLSLLQNVDFSMDIQTVDIRQIVDDAVRSMRKTTRLRHIEIDVISDDDGYTFQGDYGRLRQMLVIILDNAIKFSLDHAVIKVTLVRASGHISLSVSDTGRGIAPEDLPHIFDRFYRQRSEQNKAGTGLGLVIAKQIADRHHIEMTLQSEMNKGTVVTFVF